MAKPPPPKPARTPIPAPVRTLSDLGRKPAKPAPAKKGK